MNAPLQGAGTLAEAEQLCKLTPLPPFSGLALEFIDAFSERLRRHPETRRHPELAALAFWMRSSHLRQIEVAFRNGAADAVFMPRGTVFHIAPGNVDTLFAYSWLLSLICGNNNIVRLPSRESAQVALLERLLAELLGMPCWRTVAQRTLMVRYDSADTRATAHYSALCDMRVVWGGDATIQAVRSIALPPHASELAFANKFSLALIYAEGWINASEPVRAAWLTRFFNDAYTWGQMACSSPRLVVWHGDSGAASRAQSTFWTGLMRLMRERGNHPLPVDSVNKRVAADLIALRFPVCIPESTHGALTRVSVPNAHLADLIASDLHCGAGLFYESGVQELSELDQVLSRRIQTVTWAGYEDDRPLRQYVSGRVPGGIDRIVPFGRALEFSPVWDGHDLLRAFTRQIAMH